MLDTLRPKTLFPQFSPDPRRYLARVLYQLRHLRAADGYRLELRTMPSHENIAVAASATYEQRVAMPDRSYLFAISGSSSAAAGFDLQIRDTTNQAELCGRQTFHPNVTGQISPLFDPVPFPLFFVPRPMLFREPSEAERSLSGTANEHGEALVQIWNRAAAVNTIQVVLWFAVPERPFLEEVQA